MLVIDREVAVAVSIGPRRSNMGWVEKIGINELKLNGIRNFSNVVELDLHLS